jgi:hypothetical protein
LIVAFCKGEYFEIHDNEILGHLRLGRRSAHGVRIVAFYIYIIGCILSAGRYA